MAFLEREDIEDLKKLVWSNNCVMLPKTAIANFAAAYNVSYSTVKYRIVGIINCSYKNNRGIWSDEYRVTYGKKITQNLMNEIQYAVNNYKTHGIPIDHKLIASSCKVTENTVRGIVAEMI